MDTVTLGKQEQEKQGSKMDTLTQAKQVREKQGPWEVEVSYGGEADLHKHLIGCVKNPGHHKFVPVEQFNVDHLPPGWHDNDLVDFVRALSDLTVRVSVNHVSEGRPETVPGSDKPYPFCQYKGKNMLRTGTGSVFLVEIYPNDKDSSCKCQECLDSPTPKTQFAKIYIHTAAHVVYDKLEAAHTTCRLFFDKGHSPKHCSSVLDLSGWSFVIGGEERGDWCEMAHVTHDLDLADRLRKMVDLWEKLVNQVDNKYPRLRLEELETSSPSEHLPVAMEKMMNMYRVMKSVSSLSEYLPQFWEKMTLHLQMLESVQQEKSLEYQREVLDKILIDLEGLMSFEIMEKLVIHLQGLESGDLEMVCKTTQRLRSGVHMSPSAYLREICDNLTIIVSHPHGCSKQVSVGFCKGRDVGEDSSDWIRYTTATCPGSSGARVFVIGDCQLWMVRHIHCGNCVKDKHLNYSNTAFT